jgi:hypothetical protein
MRGMIRIRFYLILSFVLLVPLWMQAASLPADGGDPGKAYKACMDAVAKPDKPAIVALCFFKDDPWFKKVNLDYFTNETFQVEVRDLYPALRLINWKINGGQIEGDTAKLSVEGTVVRHRVETTGDIVEYDRYPAKGTVDLKRVNGVWRYAGTQELEKQYPSQ